MYKLRIVDFDNNEIKTMECKTFQQAERLELGVLINLDKSKYFTDIIKVDNE